MIPAIRVENLAKSYRVNHAEQRLPYKTLRDSLARMATAPIRRWRAGGHSGVVEQFWALNDVSFEVQPGEVIGIIGRNGAGKSTLLKIISRITKPTRGRAMLTGRVGSLLEVGTGFHPELTGRENVYLNGSILSMGRKEIDRKFDEIVAFAEVERFLDTPVKRYSSGMYVRLAFAVSAYLDPEILVVDEVLSVGDAAFQEKCLGSMRKSASSGRTVIFVSHNMSSIQQLCSRAILLQGGKIAHDGLPADVVRTYFSDVLNTKDVVVEDWHDRVTNGEARINLFEIRNAADELTSHVAIGDDVTFRIGAHFRNGSIDPTFGVVVHTAAGEPVLDIRSTHAGFRLGKVMGDIKVDVCLEGLGLYPGSYLLGPYITDASCAEVIDFPRHCSSLRVNPAPGPFGDLKLDPRWGRYHVPSNWAVV